MLTIGICDDDITVTNQLRDLLGEIMLPIADWEAQIFHSGNEVIEAIEAGQYNCGLLFTDIFMEQGSGMELARYICDHKVDTDIIFISNSQEHIYDCLHFHTFAYLLKPLSKEDIQEEIKRYMEALSHHIKCLHIENRGIKHKIPLDSILYIESDLRKLHIHTKTKTYQCYDKLSSLEQALYKDHFIRCHQSYLVSLREVTEFNASTVTMGDTTLPISRKYHDSAIAQLKEYKNKQIGGNANKTDTKTAIAKEGISYLSSGVYGDYEEKGSIVCIQGIYLGAIFRMHEKQRIVIGRDGLEADIVVNLPLVSRVHCTITYFKNDNLYEITDFSTNGTYINGKTRLAARIPYRLPAGTELTFGDPETIYKLG